jgi:hypothetical protein
MALIIVLNVLLALGVVAAIVTPLVWAIYTQHRDHVSVVTIDGQLRATPRTEYKRAHRHAGLAVARAA